jgi:ketosteroid isomerase-like protein
MSQKNVELVKGIYRAWEQGDFTGTDWAHPEIRFEVPGPDPEVRGIEAMARNWAGWLQVYSDLSIEATDYYDEGDLVVVGQAFHGKGRSSGIPLDEIAGASVFEIRDGKVVRFRGYTNLGDALAAAGIESS